MKPVPKRNRSPRGPLTVLAMFALGGAVLWGLFRAPRPASPPSPELRWGAPPRPLRFVSFDCAGRGVDAAGATLDAIRRRDPDFVLLQRVPATDVIGFVESLGLRQSYYTQLFQRTGPGGGGETGCVVLSKHKLYDTRGIRAGGRRGECFGTWAVAALDGVRFAVVSAQPGDAAAREPLARFWRDAGSPPAVIGLSPSPTGVSAERTGAGEWFAVRAGGSLLISSGWHPWDDGALAKGNAADAVTSADLAGVPAPVAVVGVPDRKLRFAAYNIYHDYRGIERTTVEVRKLHPPPDFVFLEEIEPQNVRRWSEALKAQSTYYPPLGRGPDGSTHWPDTAILSRHRLFDGRPLQMPDGQTFGMWTMALVDNKKFAVAAVHLWPTFGIDPRHLAFTGRKRNEQLKILIQTWQDAGSPPLIVGGDFNQPPVGDNYALMTEHFSDTLKSLGRDGGTFPFEFLELRIDYLLATPEWAPAAGGVMKGDASDHRLIWLDVGAGPSSRAESRPTSRQAATQPSRVR